LSPITAAVSIAGRRRRRIWDARHKAYLAALALQPGKVALITDICVPIPALAEYILETRADIDASGPTGPILGHVGDGHFHALVLFDPNSEADKSVIEGLSERLVDRALRHGGTCSGEHGIGVGKVGYLRKEHGPAVETMRAIKRALDPDDIMNPGKMFGPPAA
jgi:D-lactate dehydrogenase (cytochrome)